MRDECGPAGVDPSSLIRSSGHSGLRACDCALQQVSRRHEIAGRKIAADEAAAELQTGQRRRAAAHEGIEHHAVGRTTRRNQATRNLDRPGARMLFAPLRWWNLPDGEKRVLLVVPPVRPAETKNVFV